jgi:L-asparaginase
MRATDTEHYSGDPACSGQRPSSRQVIEGLAWGNVNQPMFAAIKDALAKSVLVVIASRVPNGRVLPNYGFERGGKTLVAAGAIMADDLSAPKARILRMLLLQNEVNDQRGLPAAFSK